MKNRRLDSFSSASLEVQKLKRSLYMGFVKVPDGESTFHTIINLLIPSSEREDVKITREGNIFFVHKEEEGTTALKFSFYFDEYHFRLLFHEDIDNDLDIIHSA